MKKNGMTIKVYEGKLDMGVDFNPQAVEIIKSKVSPRNQHTYATVKLLQDEVLTSIDISALAKFAVSNPLTVILVDDETGKPLTTKEGFLDSKGFSLAEGVKIGVNEGEFDVVSAV